MADANKNTDRAWIWPVYPFVDSSRSPNILVNTSIVRPGKDVMMRDSSSQVQISNYKIPDNKMETRRCGILYYRPKVSDLKIVKQLLDGEPGDPVWNDFFGMVINGTTSSIAAVRRMRCNEIVSMLALGDPSALRLDMKSRLDAGHEYNRTFVDISKELYRIEHDRGRFLPVISDVRVNHASVQEINTQHSRINKPDGWSRSDLVAQVQYDADSFSGSTFDRIRKKAGLLPGPRQRMGPPRRYSHRELRLLIEAVKSGKFRRGHRIADAWSKLLDE